MNMRNGRATKLIVVLTGALALTAGLAGTAAADSDHHLGKECRDSFADVDNDDGAGCRYHYDKKKEDREYRNLDHDEKDGGDEDIRYDNKGENDTPFEKMVKVFTGG
jgi:hypothetical protein